MLTNRSQNMKLAALKNCGVEKNQFRDIAEILLNSLVRSIVVATARNEQIWNHIAGNYFTTIFYGLDLSWDQLDNDTPILTIGHTSIEDDGSGSYGFSELAAAISAQQKYLDEPLRSREILAHSHSRGIIFPGCRH